MVDDAHDRHHAPPPDPGNTDPAELTEDLTEEELAEVRKLLGLDEDP